MSEDEIRLFIVDSKNDAFLSDLQPIRKKDKLVFPVTLDDLLDFIKSKGCDEYNTGFFHVGWLDVLNGGKNWYEDRMIIEKLKESKHNPLQPWFLFSGGHKEPFTPFEPPLFRKDEFQSYYAKIKDGRISTVSEFYKKIGYNQS